MPERRGGTLRAYSRHRPGQDVLAQPGEQDLTAHVNFSALQAAGEAMGLTTDAFVGQDRFLTQVAARIWTGELDFGDWTAGHTRQFQTLTHPDHLGRAFRVLVQSISPSGK
jgi:SAM-dependent MidA family methyltransferase